MFVNCLMADASESEIKHVRSRHGDSDLQYTFIIRGDELQAVEKKGTNRSKHTLLLTIKNRGGRKYLTETSWQGQIKVTSSSAQTE